MTGVLIGAYIIGSVARGESDERSDLDVLAIVKDGHGKVPLSVITDLVPPAFTGLEIGVSWYGYNRIADMFSKGELFAWHIWKEHIVLCENDFRLSEQGPPQRYVDAYADILSFERIISEIPERVSNFPHNAVYEFGLLYVCLRNIAMSASVELNGSPDFSRYSPFKLQNIRPVPIDRSNYDLAMQCRMAGQRGIDPPKFVGAAEVSERYSELAVWISELREQIGDWRTSGSTQ